MRRKPGQREPQVILDEIVIPAISTRMNKGNTNMQIARINYTSDPAVLSTYVEIITDAGDSVRLIIDPDTLES